MADRLQVEVVSAEKVVWSGEADSVIAKTTDGDMGILPGHAPVLALLVPGGVEIICPDGTNREIIAVEGGFISVAQGRVSVLSEYARMADEISMADAEKELADYRSKLDGGDESEETRLHFRRASAQVRAAQKAK